jgi:putative transposase
LAQTAIRPGFADIESARAWVLKLVTRYNGEHRQSAIGFVTPSQRHAGDASALLAHRKRVYEAARAQSTPMVAREAPMA